MKIPLKGYNEFQARGDNRMHQIEITPDAVKLLKTPELKTSKR
ncbi:MAG: hypothetical protein WBA13_18985 [Microcoleaceae cyanobacterium]